MPTTTTTTIIGIRTTRWLWASTATGTDMSQPGTPIHMCRTFTICIGTEPKWIASGRRPELAIDADPNAEGFLPGLRRPGGW